MTTAATTPTLHDKREERARSRWWFWASGALFLFAALTAYIIIVGGRDRVLAEAVLEDGTILRLEEVTFGPQQKFFVQKPPSPFLSQFGIGDPEISASAEFGEQFPQNGVWLTRRDPQTGDPLDLDWLSHCTAVDVDGWECASRFAGRLHWNTTPPQSPYQDSIFRYRAPFQPLPTGKYREIVVGAFLPVLRAQDGRFPLKVYNTQGAVVATFDAPYPAAAPAYQDWTPAKLPATEATGDLEVTLERIDWTPLPADPSIPEKRLPTIKLQPQVTFNWQGQPSEDWNFTSENIMAVEDGLGNMSYMDKCRLTPHVPAWKLGFLLLRKADGRYEPHEEWDPGPIDIPAAGEARDLNLQGEVAGKTALILKVLGPGTHQFSLSEPKCVGPITPPLSQAGAGWTVSAVHQSGKVDWTIESERPFVIWKQQPGEQLTSVGLFGRIFDSDGSHIETDEVYDYVYGNNTIVAILKASPIGPITLKPSLVDMRNVFFLIEPPAADSVSTESGIAKPQATRPPASKIGAD